MKCVDIMIKPLPNLVVYTLVDMHRNPISINHRCLSEEEVLLQVASADVCVLFTLGSQVVVQRHKLNYNDLPHREMHLVQVLTSHRCPLEGEEPLPIPLGLPPAKMLQSERKVKQLCGKLAIANKIFALLSLCSVCPLNQGKIL